MNKLNNENINHVDANDFARRMQQLIDEIDAKSMRWLELSEMGW